MPARTTRDTPDSSSCLEIELLTIFPSFFDSFLTASLVGKATERGLFSAHVRDIRTYAEPPHFSVDDTPYGGGAGMVMRPDVLVRAIEASRETLPTTRVILLSASGTPFSQAKAKELSACTALTLVCGRYEGVDQRAIDLAVDEEISIGDYVLMGGEVPAMVLIEAVLRLRPGVLGNQASTAMESFQVHSGQANSAQVNSTEAKTSEDTSHATNDSGFAPLLLEGPQYTRPAEFRGLSVPEVLLSGNHKQIEAWRNAQSRARTAQRRPDLNPQAPDAPVTPSKMTR